MAFFLGVLYATVIYSIAFWFICMRPDSEKVVVDRWWMENQDRWEWLRTHELKQAAKSGSEEAS